MLFSRFIAAGVFLSIIPSGFLAYEKALIPKHIYIDIPAEISPGMQLSTPLNQIDLHMVSGDDIFHIHDPIFVHFFQKQGSVAYPFAVTKISQILQNETPAIKGKVIDKTGSVIQIAYGFEHYRPSRKAYPDTENHRPVSLELAIDNKHRARVSAININGNWINSPLQNPSAILSDSPSRTIGTNIYRR